MIAELLGEVEILLDQDDGDISEPAQVGDGAVAVFDDRGLDALGRPNSSNSSSFSTRPIRPTPRSS
jgi:hypothetical protein